MNAENSLVDKLLIEAVASKASERMEILTERIKRIDDLGIHPKNFTSADHLLKATHLRLLRRTKEMVDAELDHIIKEYS